MGASAIGEIGEILWRYPLQLAVMGSMSGFDGSILDNWPGAQGFITD
jgi:hypothetical protein